MKNLILLSILSISLCLVSCGDDNGPVITITSPSSGDTFLAGGAISLAGTVTDDVEVSSLSIELSGGVVTTYTIDLSAATDRTTINLGSINALELDTLVTAGEYTLTLTAIDNESNSATESVDVTVQ